MPYDQSRVPDIYVTDTYMVDDDYNCIWPSVVSEMLYVFYVLLLQVGIPCHRSVTLLYFHEIMVIVTMLFEAHRMCRALRQAQIAINKVHGVNNRLCSQPPKLLSLDLGPS